MPAAWGRCRGSTLSRLGVDARVGIGPSITVAATASGQIDAPGGVLTVAPDQVAGWLGPLPVEALHAPLPSPLAVSSVVARQRPHHEHGRRRQSQPAHYSCGSRSVQAGRP